MEQKYGRIVAFIPVRGGSKSIKNKNIKIFNGRPLVYWTLDAAVNCKYVSEVYVSTDSELIASTVEKYNNKKVKVVSRSEYTATDQATTESAMLEFSCANEYEKMILMQATSPMTNSIDLDNAIEKLHNIGADSLLSVVNQKRFIWKKDKQFIEPANYNYESRPRRQDFEGFLVENGAFYITSKTNLEQTKCRLSGNITFYEMSEDSYFEIDEPEDWNILELMHKRKIDANKVGEKAKKIKLFAMDCDGVLTDGGMYYTNDGDEMKKFNTKDGVGISLLLKEGIHVAIITGEDTKIVSNRGEKLGIKEIHLGIKDKCKIMEQLILKYNISYENVAYIGDDINDLELLNKAELSFTVADAIQSIKDAVDYVSAAKGGEGAVREVAEIILKNR